MKSVNSEHSATQGSTNHVTPRIILQIPPAEGIVLVAIPLPRPFKDKLALFLESKWVSFTMTLVTVYALFAVDIRDLATHSQTDPIFFSFSSAAMFLFLIELLLSAFAKPDYLWSFYFWLDLVGTLSLLPDIGWIYGLMVGAGSSGSLNGLHSAGQASRAGTRSARIVRVIRLIRLIRIVKLYKGASAALNVNNYNSEETKVGKVLSDRIIKKVIILILTMLIVLPFLDTRFYTTDYHSWDYGVYELQLLLDLPGFSTVLNDFISYNLGSNRPLIYLEYTNVTGDYIWNSSQSYTDYRFYEIYLASSQNITAIFDITIDSRFDSGLSICNTVFICLILTIAALTFYSDADTLIIRPIEKLLSNIKQLTRDPLGLNRGEESISVPTHAKKSNCCKSQVVEAEFETAMIRNNVEKISVLLAIVFGEAGGEIIANNLGDSGKIDSLNKGKKIVGIFGFCDIRNFTDATEELQEGIMVFVNEIARVVHSITDRYFGAANKNIGDAFLIVWKFDKDDFEILEDNTISRNNRSAKASMYPDISLLSIVKVLIKINRDSNILGYRENAKLLKRMPNYSVKMGFGMHIGWAIEGALGSEYKIDVSYLSHHVNMASKLEASTKIYGIPLLISGDLHKHFSTKVKSYCRQIDRISHLDLYTFDGQYHDLTPTFKKLPMKLENRVKKNRLNSEAFHNYKQVSELFENSHSITQSRVAFTPDFFREYNVGFELFLKNRWVDAKAYFEAALDLVPNDGPLIYLLRIMRESNFCSSNRSVYL